MSSLRLAVAGDPVIYIGAELDDLYVTWLSTQLEPHDFSDGYESFRLVVSATETSPPLVDKVAGIFAVAPGPAGAPADNLRVVFEVGELDAIPEAGTYVATLVATRDDGRDLIGVGYVEFRVHAALPLGP